MNHYQLLNDTIIRIGQTAFKPWPDFLVTGLRAEVPDKLFDLLYSTETLPLLWRAKIPPPLLREISSFPKKELERLLHISQLAPEKFVDWARFCPALLLIAPGWDETDPVSALEVVVNIRQGWRSVLRQAGWPCSRSILRILRKLSIFNCSQRSLAIIAQGLESKRKLKMLCHLPHLNSGVLDLLSLPEAFLNPSLLHQVAELKAPSNGLSDLCIEIEAIRSELNAYPTWPFESGNLNHTILRKHRDELELRIATDLAHSNVKLPPPPFEGIRARDFQIAPITTIRGIFREGMEMENCAASYVRNVALGTHYLYRLEKPERATVLFTKGAELWVPTQIKTPQNGEPKKQTVRAVQIFAGTIPTKLLNDEYPF